VPWKHAVLRSSSPNYETMLRKDSNRVERKPILVRFRLTERSRNVSRSANSSFRFLSLT
jgi:hypothetical protein